MGIDRKISAVRRRGIGGRVVTLLLLVAFALQSYLTQTHIHGVSGSPAQVCASKCIVHMPNQPSPFGEATDCPLCQAIVHAGSFFAPAIVAITAPRIWVEYLITAPQIFALSGAPARSGLSRAPPR